MNFLTAPIIIIGIVILYILSSIKILREYERGVIFRLGRVLSKPKGPGIILVFSPIDRMVQSQPSGWSPMTSPRRTSLPGTTSR